MRHTHLHLTLRNALTDRLLPLVLVLCCGTLLGLRAEAAEPYISFSYRDVPVAEVIEDLERRYGLTFSYQPTVELLEYRVSARSGLIIIPEGLKLLFAGSPIEHRMIRGQIALRYNRRLAEELLSQLEEEAQPPPRRNPQPPPPEPEPEEVVVAPPPRPERDTRPAAERIPTEEAEEIPWITSPALPTEAYTETNKSGKRRALGQFSVLPGLSTHPGREREYINTISINAPFGVSGGVVGAEIGVALNAIDGDLEGLQLAGGINLVKGRLTGVQIAGLLNASAIGTGVQISGAANYCRRTLQGTQIAPLLNVALNGVGSQYSLGLNVSEGDVRNQIGLFNRGQNVARGQIGLINISDTIAGRPIGLINFVKKGYNVIEFARTSVMPYALSVRLGAHRLYNIFEFSGGRRDLSLLDGTDETEKQPIWGIGYGFGWANKRGNNPRNRYTTEIVGTHLSRSGSWEKRLNFVLSTRLSIDWGPGRGSHFFIGPVFNLHWTQLSDDELDGFFVSGWQLWKRRYDKTAFRGVLGVRFGIRIGRN